MADNVFLVGIGAAVVGSAVVAGQIDWQTIGVVAVIIGAIMLHLWLQAYDRR